MLCSPVRLQSFFFARDPLTRASTASLLTSSVIRRPLCSSPVSCNLILSLPRLHELFRNCTASHGMGSSPKGSLATISAPSSLALTSMPPTGANAKPNGERLKIAGYVLRFSPSDTRQTLVVPFLSPDARNSPPRENATSVTPLSCPSSVRMWLPFVTSQSRIVPSSLAVAKTELFGANASRLI